jgi:phosphatidylserine decarboxylase
MIAPEGWPFVLVPLCVGVAAVVLGFPLAGWVLVALGLFGLLFFRDPERRCDQPPEVVCSPADGRVVVVGPAPRVLAEKGLPIQVSVFMSPLNVHVNRAPTDGELVEYSYTPGKKVPAFNEKASLENEQNLSIWEGPLGRVGVKQIAGTIARRIVFDHGLGARVRRAERIGLIRYGSRVDVFLPEDAEVLVAVGHRVRAGESALARLQPPRAS